MSRLLIKTRVVCYCRVVLVGFIAFALGFQERFAQETLPTGASPALEKLQLLIRADQERYGAMFQGAELEALAQLISPAERKTYALGVESWLQTRLYATYLTLRRQQKRGETFPVARLQNLFDQFDVFYQMLEDPAPGDLAVLKLQLNKEELYLVAYQAAQATDLAAQAQERLVRLGRAVLAHPQAQWREHLLVAPERCERAQLGHECVAGGDVHA